MRIALAQYALDDEVAANIEKALGFVSEAAAAGACNRVGTEGDAVFCGESIVIDPYGRVVAKADAGERLLLADVNLLDAGVARSKRPYLALRRPQMYER
jgi:predicted amidohydrolase